jgi:hypothetical protein
MALATPTAAAAASRAQAPRVAAAPVSTPHVAAATSTPAAAVKANTLAPWAYGPNGHVAPNCASAVSLCTEVFGWEGTFPYYVGHDEPSMLFYSNQPGSGYQMTYQLTLPSDPGNPTNYSLASPSNSYNMLLHPAFWFGMAMCDTQSYPQQRLKTGTGSTTDPSLCPPHSDGNVTPDTFAGLSSHAGTAFMEMQFYPPGDNHQPDAVNPCLVGQGPGNNQWCAAMNIDSLSEDPINGTQLNSTCTGVVGSAEYVNFGIVTTSGASTGPVNPVDSTQTTYDGNPAGPPTFFMNNGDKLQVTFNDIPDASPGPNGSGLQVVINDLTTGTSGSMVASSKNQFGMVQYAPNSGPNVSTACTSILYNFHPMYDTSSVGGRVIWAAHTYNISYSDEIGHGERCSNAALPYHLGGLTCNPQNLAAITESDMAETSDADDTSCFPPSAPGTLPITRCIGINGGFDGYSYQNTWPTSETPSATVPTPVTFSSPLTGGSDAAHDTVQYSNAAFETDLPRVEAPDIPATKNSCQRFAVDNNGNPIAGAGSNCVILPRTDETTVAAAVPATFYPWFNSYTTAAGCVWQEGGIPGNGTTINDFGKNNQYLASPNNAYGYGSLYPVTYLDGSGTTPAAGTTKLQVRLQDFHGDLHGNPCPAAVSTPLVPEAPTVWLLPISALLLALGFAAVARRRSRHPLA